MSKGETSQGLWRLGRDADQSPTFSSDLRMGVVVIPLFIYAFMACTGTLLPLFLHHALNKASEVSDSACDSPL